MKRVNGPTERLPWWGITCYWSRSSFSPSRECISLGVPSLVAKGQGEEHLKQVYVPICRVPAISSWVPFALLILADFARAQRRDVVVKKTGDRITGQVKS
jgi:hypothetical protein